MPLRQEPALTEPESDNQVIWRYLSYPKLLSLLGSTEIRFTRADQFADPLEGYLPRNTMLEWAEQAQQKNRETAKAWDWGDEIDLVEGLLEKNPFELIQHHRKLAFVSCWNADSEEKEKLWKQYTPGGKGVVIKSTVGRLKEAIQDIKSEHLSIGEVQYRDFEEGQASFFMDFIQQPFAYKDTEYADEREIRAIVFEKGFNQDEYGFLRWQEIVDNEADYRDYLRDSKPVSFRQRSEYRDKPVTTAVHIEKLIMEIRISPFGSSWQRKTLESVLSNQFELSIDVEESSLDVETGSSKPAVDVNPDQLYSEISDKDFLTLEDLANINYDADW